MNTDKPASRALLHALWHGLLNACIAYLRDTPAERRRAAMLSVIRSFLADNGVSAESIARDGLEGVTKELREKMALPFPAPQ